jgi:hypothetical protein
MISGSIIEQFNEPVTNPRLSTPMPEAQVTGPSFDLTQIIQDSKQKCSECGETLTGTECADCARQIIL